MNNFDNITNDDLMNIDGGLWGEISGAAGFAGMGVAIGKGVATAATVTAVCGLAAGAGIAVCMAGATYCVAKAITKK